MPSDPFTDSGHSACAACGTPLVAQLGGQCPRCLLGLAETAESPSQPAPFPTRQFGDYELLEEIARGGMGVVYRARQPRLNRAVALKMILAGELAGPEALRMFQREAHAAANLHHPNIVPVYEIGEHELQHYFTMRLVPGGRTIADWAKMRRGQWRELAVAAAQAARAVAFAHSHGVLHRDLKPSNILWDDAAGPQVTDFGLAKLLDESDGQITVSARVLGSPNYMAPEQVAGRSADITTATDVYGLGAVLYELLSGQPPFRGMSALDTMRRAAEEAPEPLPNVPADLGTICLKCLEKDPALRYRSAASLAEDLERFTRGEPVSAVPLTSLQIGWRWAKRRPQMAALVLLSAASVVAGIAGIAWQWRKAERARRGESRALAQATSTVVDLHTHAGLTAAKVGDTTRAALWFANAAMAAADPARQALELARQAAWRADSATVVRAFVSDVGPVGKIRWSPSESALAIQSRNGPESSIWDLAAEQPWQPVPGKPIRAAIWANRARWLAYHCEGAMKVTDFPDGRTLSELAVAGPVTCAAVSPDDRLIAVGTTVPFLWNLATGQKTDLPDRLGLLTGLEFSRNGQFLLLTGQSNRAVCALSSPSRFLHEPVPAHALEDVGFLGEGQQYFTTLPEGVLQVRESESGRVEETYQTSPEVYEQTHDVSPDGRFLGRHSNTVIERGAEPKSFPTHQNRFEAMDFSRDGEWLLTGGYDAILRLWHLPDGESGPAVGWHQFGITAVALSPDHRRMASAQWEGSVIRVWQLPTPPPHRDIPAPESSGVKLSADGALLVLRGWSRDTDAMSRTRVFRIDDGSPVGPELDPDGRILDAEFSPDGAWIVLTCWNEGSDAGEGTASLQFWDYRTGRRLGDPVPLPAEPRRLSMAPDGDAVGIYDGRGRLMELNVATRELRILHGPTHDKTFDGFGNCRYSPDGSLLVAWGLNRPTIVWERGSGRQLPLAGPSASRVMEVDFRDGTMATVSLESPINFLTVSGLDPAAAPIQNTDWLFVGRFSPDGRQFLSGGRSGMARIWDWKRGTPECPTLQHEGEVFAGAFVPGTDVVATGALDQQIRLWDRHTGLPLRPPLPQDCRVMELVSTPDGVNLIRANYYSDHVRIYQVADLLPQASLPPPDALLLGEIDAAAEIRNGGLEPLTAAEWIRRWQEFRRRHPEWHPW